MTRFFVLLVCLPIGVHGVLPNGGPNPMSADVSISDVEDLHHHLETSDDLNRTLNYICSRASLTCRSRCGLKGDWNLGYSKDITICSCDAICLTYGDCCWDFHTFCPHQVDMYNQQRLYRAGTVFIGGYNFLVYKPGGDGSNSSLTGEGRENERETARRTPLNGDVSCMTLGDIVEILRSEGNPVTDLTTGHRYRSARDFALIHPDIRWNSQERLVNWKSIVAILNEPTDEYLEALVQNQVQVGLKSGEVTLLFQPYYESIDEVRNLPLKGGLDCFNNKSIWVANVSMACGALPTAPEILQRRLTMPITVPAAIPTSPILTTEMFSSTATSFDRGRAGLEKTNLLSRLTTTTATTEKTTLGMDTDMDPLHTKSLPSQISLSSVTSITSPLCKTEFIISAGSQRGRLPFSALMDLTVPTEVHLTENTQSSAWTLLNCSAKVTSRDRGIIGCKSQPLCSSAMIPFHETCARPQMLLLKVTSYSAGNHTDLYPHVKSLTEASGLLTSPGLTVSQDKLSCYSGQLEPARTTYYGLYHIETYTLDPPTDSHLPLSDKMAEALSRLDTRKQMQVELCLLMATPGSNISAEIIKERGINTTDVSYYNHSESSNTATEPSVCREIPWLWRKDDIFQNRHLLCESIPNAQPSPYQRLECEIENCKDTDTSSKGRQQLFVFSSVSHLVFCYVTVALVLKYYFT